MNAKVIFIEKKQNRYIFFNFQYPTTKTKCHFLDPSMMCTLLGSNPKGLSKVRVNLWKAPNKSKESMSDIIDIICISVVCLGFSG